MKMDYTHKRQPETDGIYNMYLRSPGYVGAGKTAWTYIRVSICNNCKKILGTHSGD